MFPVKARIVEIAIERYKSLRDDRDVPSVAKASENTTWPTSADSTVANPTAVTAMLLADWELFRPVFGKDKRKEILGVPTTVVIQDSKSLSPQQG